MQLHIQKTVLTWDEAKRLRNLQEHRVDFADLVPFFDGCLLTGEDEREAYGEQRFQSVGFIDQDCLFVVWVLRNAGETPHIISARKAKKHEAQKWHEFFSRYS